MQENIFEDKVKKASLDLKRNQVRVLQVNVGKLCNLACHHCHVDAGPRRTEILSEDVADRLIYLIAQSPNLETIDFTGGAPELNPYFRKLVTASRKLKKEVIVRCNITVLFEKNQEDTAEFFKNNQVKIVASLPCYTKENVEKQRGRGVFDKSIEGLKMLNRLGYGNPQSSLVLDLVYNPGGAFLPGDQKKLESDYKKELKQVFDIDFNNLYTITNMPINRFADDLKKNGKLDDYYELLLTHFNQNSIPHLMCKNLLSISYDGKIYDCDFNQMLNFPLLSARNDIWRIDNFNNVFSDVLINTSKHCLGCSAGAGSSCSGAIA